MRTRYRTGLAALGVIAIGGIVYHHVTSQAQLARYTALCETFLTAQAELPAASVEPIIKRTTVPGAQAALLTAWLKEQDQAVIAEDHLTPATAHATLTHVTLSHSQGTPILNAQFSVTRHFHPKGQTSETGLVSFWIQSGPAPRIEAESLNTSPLNYNGAPDRFNLNQWNLVPAPGLPQGQ